MGGANPIFPHFPPQILPPFIAPSLSPAPWPRSPAPFLMYAFSRPMAAVLSEAGGAPGQSPGTGTAPQGTGRGGASSPQRAGPRQKGRGFRSGSPIRKRNLATFGQSERDPRPRPSLQEAEPQPQHPVKGPGGAALSPKIGGVSPKIGGF